MSFSTRPGSLSSALMRLDIDLSGDTGEIAVSRDSTSTLRHDISGGLDGLAAAIPIALCGIAIVYVNFPAAYLSNGVFVTLMALALMHAISAAGGRPMVFSARLFEATTLSAMLGQFVKLAPAWGLVATPEVLLALTCVVGAMAAFVCSLLFLLRADRFTRLIPAPVYAGFAISISVLLLISQSRALWQLWNTGHTAAMLVSVCFVATAVNVGVRRLRPRWPASAIGLIAAAAVALVWLAAGFHVAMVMQLGQPLALPWAQADFAALLAPATAKGILVKTLVYNAVLLGLILFVNMTVANEILSQADDCYASRWMHATLCLCGAAGAAVGSVPLAGSQLAAAAALRTSALTRRKVFIIALGTLLIALSGALHWIALAAVAGVMLCESFYMADRASIKEAWRWLSGADLPRSKLEDLTLVLAVTVAAVLFNAAVAIFVGLLLGLLMFAARNAKQPVRHVWTGEQLQSNCARGARELALLTQHGQLIKVIELEFELFFGAIASLDQSLTASLTRTHTVIVDWSRVRHVDSSIALAIARWVRAARQAQVQVLHAGAGLEAGNALEFLNQYFGQAVTLPDLDRALEAAENALIGERIGERSLHATVMHEQIPLFAGLSTVQLKQMQASMRERLYLEDEVIFNAGDASDSMLVILQGRASVMMNSGGRMVRLTSMRRGGVVGEMGFLDRAPRSATVIAQKQVLAYVLTREAFDALREKWPDTAYILIKNLTLNLAVRLRHTNRVAMARNAVK